MATNGVDGESSADRNVEIWKIKKLIKSLEAARGYLLDMYTSCVIANPVDILILPENVTRVFVILTSVLKTSE